MTDKDKGRIRPVVVEESIVEQSSLETQIDLNSQAKDEQVSNEPEEINKKFQKQENSLNQKINIKLMFLVTILTALIVGFVAGGVYVYFSGVTGLSETESTGPEPTPTPKVEPSPTPRPSLSESPVPEKIDFSNYKLSVLNGSGKIGEAGKVRDLLKASGFTVSNVGNALRYDYTDTVIQAMDEVPKKVIDLITEILSNNYSIKVGDKLPSTSKYEIVITVGSK